MTEKELVLKAIKDGEYEVEIIEPNNFRSKTHFDGTPFYIVVGDDIKFGVCAGSCIVHVGGHSFTCDLDTGEWEEEDILDQEIIEALENADGVMYGEHLDLEQQWEVFSAANNITEDIPYFWCEDDECFKDVDSLGFYEADVTFRYAPKDSGLWEDLVGEANCESIYDIYKFLKEKRGEELDSGREIVLSGEDIRDISTDLYEELTDQAKGEIDEGRDVEISLTVSKAFFEEALK